MPAALLAVRISANLERGDRGLQVGGYGFIRHCKNAVPGLFGGDSISRMRESGLSSLGYFNRK
jgi:hypothetical protein